MFYCDWQRFSIPDNGCAYRYNTAGTSIFILCLSDAHAETLLALRSGLADEKASRV